MTPEKSRTVVIGLVCAGIVLLAFAGGLFLMPGDGGGGALPAGGGPVAGASNAGAGNGNTEAKVAAPAPAKSAPVPTTVKDLEWRPQKSGCTIEQTGTTIHISGTNSTDGWGHENGVASTTDYPVQDFDISTDFTMPKFEGPGNSMVFLRARESSYNAVTLQYYLQGDRYMLRWWTRGGEEFAKTTQPGFGNERKTAHRFRMKYDAAKHQVTGWVDDKTVGTLDFEFRSNVRFMMGADTDKKGNDIDLTYDHTTLILGGNIVDPEL